MSIFKYQVTNSTGKNLNGTVEAPNEEIARTELNNMGFSIISLEHTNEIPKGNKDMKKFVFESIDKNSKLISGTIPAKDKEDAYTKLKEGYDFNVTAIWEEDASENEIEEARKEGLEKHNIQLVENEKAQTREQQNKQKEQQTVRFIQNKIEEVLKKVNELLKRYSADFDPATQKEIDKKIDKILRIKNSTNLDYILKTAEDLLLTIKKQSDQLKEKGEQQKSFDLEMETKKILGNLNETEASKTFEEDVIEKLNKWEGKIENRKPSKANEILENAIIKVRQKFTTPTHIKIIKQQIKHYNKLLIEYLKLYFKEPTKEYKDKVKTQLIKTWESRKKAVHSLKYANKFTKIIGSNSEKIDTWNTKLPIIEELNSLSGWLLTFYIIYYFIGIKITTINFGMQEIPQGFNIMATHIFKYLLIILFLVHASTALKVNFFKNNQIASIILPLIMVTLSIITILNF